MLNLEDIQCNRVDCVGKLNQCNGIRLRRESIDEGTKHHVVTINATIHPDEYERGDNWSLMAGILLLTKLQPIIQECISFLKGVLPIPLFMMTSA